MATVDLMANPSGGGLEDDAVLAWSIAQRRSGGVKLLLTALVVAGAGAAIALTAPILRWRLMGAIAVVIGAALGIAGAAIVIGARARAVAALTPHLPRAIARAGHPPTGT